MTQPPRRAPGDLSFCLLGGDAGMFGRGVRARYGSVGGAVDALTGRRAEMVTGALGFDTSGSAALIVPHRIERSAGARPSTAPNRTAASLTPAPAAEHRRRVTAALTAIAVGEVEKVVLARGLTARFAESLSPEELIGDFTATATAGATVFAAPLDERGHDGRWLIGASPELLLRKRGAVVTCEPYAGSAARRADPAADAEAAAGLAASEKDRREHAYVVDDLRRRLAPLCRELEAPDAPLLRHTPQLWHLATPIRGVLADPSVTALELAAQLSPTPAVCGTPTAAAAAVIDRIEGAREFYAGTVGWCDAAGDGDWLVSIRCLELSADRHTVRSWAGGGIVAGSDPDAEVAETEVKFGTVLSALGLPPLR
ncbi:isochorismate synthase MenF [Gordonia sp. VNK21]|uniref:isochorismate synthase n=1 Tax=Gordonia sp. VNK21 TaxID=3382483 RepID=UPI0038D35E33